MSGTWYLVADAARARLVEFDSTIPPWSHYPPPPRLIAEWHEDVPSGRELVSDRPGRTFDRKGEHRHAAEPPTAPRRVVKARFAERLVERLTAELDAGRPSSLVVVAPPQFMGELRRVMPQRVRAAVEREVLSDLTGLDLFSLEAHLVGTTV